MSWLRSLLGEALGADLGLDLVTVGALVDDGAQAIADLLELVGARAGFHDGLDDEVSVAVRGNLLKSGGVEDELVEHDAADLGVASSDDLLSDVAAELVARQAEEVTREAVDGVAGHDAGLGMLHAALNDVVAEGIAGQVSEGGQQGLGDEVLLLGGAALEDAHQRDASLLCGGEVLGVVRHDLDDGLEVGALMTLEEGLEDAAGVLGQSAHVEDQLAVEDIHQLGQLVLVDDLDEGADDVATMGVEHDALGLDDEFVKDGLDLVEVLEAHDGLEHGATIGSAGNLGQRALGLLELLDDGVTSALFAFHHRHAEAHGGGVHHGDAGAGAAHGLLWAHSGHHGVVAVRVHVVAVHVGAVCFLVVQVAGLVVLAGRAQAFGGRVLAVHGRHGGGLVTVGAVAQILGERLEFSGGGLVGAGALAFHAHLLRVRGDVHHAVHREVSSVGSRDGAGSNRSETERGAHKQDDDKFRITK